MSASEKGKKRERDEKGNDDINRTYLISIQVSCNSFDIFLKLILFRFAFFSLFLFCFDVVIDLVGLLINFIGTCNLYHLVKKKKKQHNTTKETKTKLD